MDKDNVNVVSASDSRTAANNIFWKIKKGKKGKLWNNVDHVLAKQRHICCVMLWLVTFSTTDHDATIIGPGHMILMIEQPVSQL